VTLTPAENNRSQPIRCGGWSAEEYSVAGVCGINGNSPWRGMCCEYFDIIHVHMIANHESSDHEIMIGDITHGSLWCIRAS